MRTGNGAWDQVQLDVYGEVLDWMSLHAELGGMLGGRLPQDPARRPPALLSRLDPALNAH